MSQSDDNGNDGNTNTHGNDGNVNTNGNGNGNTSSNTSDNTNNTTNDNSSNNSSSSGNSGNSSNSSSSNYIQQSIQIIDASGFEIVNKQGLDASGNFLGNTTFTSTEPDKYIPNINENLEEIVKIYNDDDDPNNPNTVLMNQIRTYANEIKCSDFHGKGTIDDYANLFEAACKIANETKQIQLDVEIDGFNEFAQAADDLSNLFQTFIVKLQNVNIINDTAFLTAISNALHKIVNLSNVFGRFKETILSTTTIQMPKSAHDATLVIENVLEELDCAMKYITNFVQPTDLSLCDAQLSDVEKNIIANAVTTIDNWNILCNQGVSIAMSGNPDIRYIKQANSDLRQRTQVLKTATNNMRVKINNYLY
jgi:hypothetical protein